MTLTAIITAMVYKQFSLIISRLSYLQYHCYIENILLFLPFVKQIIFPFWLQPSCFSLSLHINSSFSLLLKRSSPRPISIGQLNTLLHLHLRPIYLVVFKGSYFTWNGKSHLGVGFTLRCFQRLSAPHFATLLCRWHDNRCTIGASIPVLSY